MPSITIRRHPATIYYFLSHHFLDRKLSPDLRIRFDMWEGHKCPVGSFAVCPENDTFIAKACVTLVQFEHENFDRNIIFESDDEELLVWLQMAMPKRWVMDDD